MRFKDVLKNINPQMPDSYINEFCTDMDHVCDKCLSDIQIELMEFDNDTDMFKCTKCGYSYSFWRDMDKVEDSVSQRFTVAN